VIRLNVEVDAFHAATRLVGSGAFTRPVDARSVEELALVIVAATFLTNTRVISADAVVVVVTNSMA
jgi:hypothetical protein